MKCLNIVSIQGGRYIPLKYLEKPYSKIEYAYYNENRFLSAVELRQELGKCIEDEFPENLNDFEELKKKGYQIEFDYLSTDVILAEKDLIISAAIMVYLLKTKSCKPVFFLARSIFLCFWNHLINQIL